LTPLTRSDGSLGITFKGAGVDALLINLAAENPTLHKVKNGIVGFLLGDNLWGQTTCTAQVALESTYCNHIDCAIIGPAVKNHVCFANIVTDGCYGASCMGLGQGDRNVKHFRRINNLQTLNTPSRPPGTLPLGEGKGRG